MRASFCLIFSLIVVAAALAAAGAAVLFLMRNRKKDKLPPPALPPPVRSLPPATPSWQSSAGSVPQELAANEVLALYNSSDRPAFLDVREEVERRDSGYIPGSIHIPMHEVQGRMDELEPTRPVVVYCASGMRSMDVGAFLLEQGFADVSNLNGGLAKWSGPIEKPI